MNWLERIKGPKYLRYFFYIAYSWYRPYVSERGNAHFSALLFLSAVHIPLIFLILIFVGEKNMPIENFRGLIYLFILLAIHYYLFYYKSKWKKIEKEFKHLEKKDRLKGTFCLLAYLLCTYSTFFGIIIFTDKK